MISKLGWFYMNFTRIFFKCCNFWPEFIARFSKIINKNKNLPDLKIAEISYVNNVVILNVQVTGQYIVFKHTIEEILSRKMLDLFDDEERAIILKLSKFDANDLEHLTLVASSLVLCSIENLATDNPLLKFEIELGGNKFFKETSFKEIRNNKYLVDKISPLISYHLGYNEANSNFIKNLNEISNLAH